MLKSNIKRPTIAFFINALEEDYTETLCRGINDAAEENDVNLIMLPGETINMNYEGQYNYNIVYEFVSYHNVDALVLASSVLCQCVTKAEFEKFCLRYKSIPLVSIGVPIEGIPSVLVNNRTGLRWIADHLIKEHHRRKIAFIKGPEGHSEAEERFLVYQEALKENGLDYDPDLVIQGDFTGYSVRNAIKILMDERKVTFDAIMAANDAMAFQILDSLRERRIHVPNEVSVTGFDDGEGAKYSNPSMTTVKQPIYECAKKALEIALKFIEGGRPSGVVLDTKMIIRESCGCLSETLQLFNSSKFVSELGSLDECRLNLDRIINRFVDQNMEAVDTEGAKLGFLKPFILNCFQIFSGNGSDQKEAEKQLRSFESQINIGELNGKDILTIQKTLTNLKKWLEPFAQNNNILIMEDFFQRLRVLITDILIKMHGTRLKSHHMDIHHLKWLLVEMVSKIHDYKEQLQTVIPRMRDMGINNCYVYLYKKPVIYRRDDIWENPPIVNLAMAYNDENWELPKGFYQIPWEKILNNEWLPRNKRYTMMFYPLFVEEEHLGLILLQFNIPNNYMFEPVVVEMSCALKLSLLFHEREQIDNRLQEVVKELEEYNQKLNNISQTDELTGLYNRRGFLNLANQSLNLARKRKKNGLVFFADMDGLKKINDQYGHDEGDDAIKAMGRILVKTFRAADIVSRIGGDEFTIFTVDSDIELLPIIKERLQQNTTEFNHESGKPYKLSITIGAVSFQSNEDVTIEKLISQADNILYEEKKRKKEK